LSLHLSSLVVSLAVTLVVSHDPALVVALIV
jgi:hypothetical protein